jgi:predicted O-methyltransferase YrrM
MKDFDINFLEQMAKRFNPLPTGNKFLNARYEWQANENGAEWPYYRFFYHLSDILRPGLILELGTYQATAAAHFAAGLLEDIKSTVITVDHHTDPGDGANQLKVLEAQEIFLNLVYYQGWTTDNIAASQKGKHVKDVGSVYDKILRHTLYYERGIDILFVDSWHHYEYAREDWETYRPLLSNPALVICDDIQDGGGPESPIQGMMQFWDEMPEPKFLNANLHPGTNMGFVKYII